VLFFDVAMLAESVHEQLLLQRKLAASPRLGEAETLLEQVDLHFSKSHIEQILYYLQF